MRPGVSTTSESAVRSAVTASATSLEVIMEQEQTIIPDRTRKSRQSLPLRGGRTLAAQGIVGPEQTRCDATPGPPSVSNFVHLHERRALRKHERVLDRMLERKIAGR